MIAALIVMLTVACAPTTLTSKKSPKSEGHALVRPMAPVDSRLDVVNPFIGTGGWGFGAGSITPGPQTPNGMIRPAPDTSFDHIAWPWQHFSGYWYEDTHIRGFSNSHLVGVGLNDQGVVRIMPALGFDRSKTRESGYRQRFSHENEFAGVGWYRVELEPSQILVELAAGDRAALNRYTFPLSSAPPTVVIDVGTAIVDGHVRGGQAHIDPVAREISGVVALAGNFSRVYGGLPTYYVIRFSEPFADYGTFRSGRIKEDETEIDGQHSGAYVQFFARRVVVAVGISYIDTSHARAHIDCDLPGFDFERTVLSAREKWAEKLGLIEVAGGSREQRRIFQTALYNTFRLPTLFTEAGDEYAGFDGRIHRAQGFRYYTDISLWDTFRTVHPLYNLLDPELNRDLVISLVDMARQSGHFPVWPMGRGDGDCMIGTHADSVIAEAAVKGVSGVDYRGALELMADQKRRDRDDIEHYNSAGYCAADRTAQAVSKTLEYAYDDSCIAALADVLGDTGLSAVFRERSKNYRHVWDSRTGYFRARKSNGAFTWPFRSRWVFDRDYVEGNAKHWVWFVPHDAGGLRNLMGGNNAAAGRLNQFFLDATKHPDTALPDAAYWHGNEPDIHAAYLFNHFGRPDLTQKWVRWIMDQKYSESPDGLDGNDDAGTLSAWYIWSALGLYPLDPCSGRYEIGSPLFDRASVQLPGGELLIVAENQAMDHPYVASVKWNGKKLDRLWLSHAEIRNGGELRFMMSDSPVGVDRGSGQGENPME